MLLLSQKGHVIKYCKKKPKSQNLSEYKSNEGQRGNNAVFVAESDTLNTKEISEADIWTLDSGASRHDFSS